VTHLNTFSRALHRLHVSSSSFDWFTGLFVSLVIDLSCYFGLVSYVTQLKAALLVNQSINEQELSKLDQNSSVYEKKIIINKLHFQINNLLKINA